MCFALLIRVFFFIPVFFFIVLSRNLLSATSVIYLDSSSSLADVVLKIHSFSISIILLQKPFGVYTSVCFAQKNSAVVVRVSFR